MHCQSQSNTCGRTGLQVINMQRSRAWRRFLHLAVLHGAEQHTTHPQHFKLHKKCQCTLVPGPSNHFSVQLVQNCLLQPYGGREKELQQGTQASKTTYLWMLHISHCKLIKHICPFLQVLIMQCVMSPNNSVTNMTQFSHFQIFYLDNLRTNNNPNAFSTPRFTIYTSNIVWSMISSDEAKTTKGATTSVRSEVCTITIHASLILANIRIQLLQFEVSVCHYYYKYVQFVLK
jgi:hypothetical protein